MAAHIKGLAVPIHNRDRDIYERDRDREGDRVRDRKSQRAAETYH